MQNVTKNVALGEDGVQAESLHEPDDPFPDTDVNFAFVPGFIRAHTNCR